MRILHVTDASSAGVLSAVTTLAAAQSALPGVEVAFAYTPRPDSPSQEAIEALCGDEVTVTRLCSSPKLAVPALTRALMAALSLNEADVVHVHSSRGGFLGRVLAAVTGRRSRVVYSPHGFAFKGLEHGERAKSVYRALERLGARLVPRLVLCSPSEERLAREVAPHADTAVLPNAVDVDALAAVRAAARPDPDGDPGRPLTVVHVGRLAEHKRPEVFAAAAQRWAARSDAPLRFRWLGDGDRSLLPAQVQVSGWLPKERLIAELAGADLMLFTSAGEGLPMALLEAQAMGIPAIGEDVTGIEDVIEDGVTGYLVHSDEEIDAALAELTADAGLRRRLGLAAASSVASRYGFMELGEKSMDVYAELGLVARSRGKV